MIYMPLKEPRSRRERERVQCRSKGITLHKLKYTEWKVEYRFKFSSTLLRREREWMWIGKKIGSWIASYRMRVSSSLRSCKCNLFVMLILLCWPLLRSIYFFFCFSLFTSRTFSSPHSTAAAQVAAWLFFSSSFLAFATILSQCILSLIVIFTFDGGDFSLSHSLSLCFSSALFFHSVFVSVFVWVFSLFLAKFWFWFLSKCSRTHITFAKATDPKFTRIYVK